MLGAQLPRPMTSNLPLSSTWLSTLSTVRWTSARTTACSTLNIVDSSWLNVLLHAAAACWRALLLLLHLQPTVSVSVSVCTVGHVRQQVACRPRALSVETNWDFGWLPTWIFWTDVTFVAAPGVAASKFTEHA